MTATRRPARLVVLGDANPDVILRVNLGALKPREQEVLVRDGVLTIGGSSSIFACAAARLGVPTSFVGVVGDDVAGGVVIDGLRDAGVDVTACRVEIGARTAITVVLSGDDDRSIVTASGTPPSPEVETIVAALRGATHVHVGAFFMVPKLAEALPELFASARVGGATTSLDTNWDPSGAWTGLEPLAGALDYLVVNEQEALHLTGEETIELAAAALRPIADTRVVKLGAQGALAFLPTGEVLRAEPFAVEAQDTTGAGDNFAAGFICGRVNGLGIDESLDLGCACGALSTRALGGADARITLEEALKLARSRR